jgi:hypothetical protein
MRKGIVVLSFTSINDHDPALSYRNIKTGDGGEISIETNKNPLDWQSPKGRLVVIELDSGSYQFYRWAFLLGVQRVLPDKDFAIPFEILPGKATYIGNLHFGISLKTRDYELTVSDQSDRDLTLFHKRFGNIKSSDVIRSITKQDIDH